MKLTICSSLFGTSITPRWRASFRKTWKSSVHRKVRNHNTWKEIKVVFSIRHNHINTGGQLRALLSSKQSLMLSPASQPHLYISDVNRRFCPNVRLKCDSLLFHTAVVNVFFPVRLCSANIFDNIQTFTSLAATTVKGHFTFTPNPPPPRV